MIIPHHGRTPQIDPSAYIQRSAQIIGDVQIGPESSVWFNSVVRGDVCHIRLGARVNIQEIPPFTSLVAESQPSSATVYLSPIMLWCMRVALVISLWSAWALLSWMGLKWGKNVSLAQGRWSPHGRRFRRIRWCLGTQAR